MFVQEDDIPPPVGLGGERGPSPGRNNQLIIFKTDRPGGKDTGYNSEKGTGTIHIVVGRKEQDTSFENDSAFIYTTMKTDVDVNLGLDNMKYGNGGALTPAVGPAILMKSDNVRVVYRKTGDIRITSDDGQDFIQMQDGRLEIKLGSAWLMMHNGTITIEAGSIALGENAGPDRVILGNKFMELFNKHTHQSPTGPTSSPIQPMTEDQLSEKSIVE
jgi:hypothetical protein